MELVLIAEEGERTGQVLKSFQLTRIRCWKVDQSDTDNNVSYLMFDYLIAQEQMRWITIKTSKAILMSMSLQSAVDELLRLRAGRPVRKPKDRQKRKKSSQVNA